MIILSFLFRDEWHYGIIKTPPKLNKFIGYDGSFDYQSKDVFTLFIDSTNKKVTINKKPSDAERKKVYEQFYGDNHYSSNDIENIVKTKYTKTRLKFTQNLFLPIRAVWTNENGWQYQTVYDEKDVITKKEHNNGSTGVECLWFDSVQDICEFLNTEVENV